MSFLSFVVLVVPALIGIGMSATYGPSRGVLLGGLITLVAVFVLLMFQVSPPETGPGAETGRAGYALGLMQFELIRWGPSFLVGAAVDSLIFRARRPVTR